MGNLSRDGQGLSTGSSCCRAEVASSLSGWGCKKSWTVHFTVVLLPPPPNPYIGSLFFFYTNCPRITSPTATQQQLNILGYCFAFILRPSGPINPILKSYVRRCPQPSSSTSSVVVNSIIKRGQQKKMSVQETVEMFKLKNQSRKLWQVS